MFKKLLLASALLVTFASAQAQSSQPFGVTGTVTPAPCKVTLTGGIVNLGTVSQATAKTYSVRSSATTFYIAALQSIPISITCSAATRVQVSFLDNKPGKFLPVDGYDAIRFGMTDGAAGTVAVGAYEMRFLPTTTIDGVAVGTYLHAANGATTWSKETGTTTGGANSYISSGFATGFAKDAAAVAPESITALSGSLEMQVLLGKAFVDGITTNFVPTGSGTLTLAYL